MSGQARMSRVTSGNKTEEKPAGRVPPDAFLFVSQQKGSKKWLLLRRASLSRSLYVPYGFRKQ
jgi:hypothetical protein